MDHLLGDNNVYLSAKALLQKQRPNVFSLQKRFEKSYETKSCVCSICRSFPTLLQNRFLMTVLRINADSFHLLVHFKASKLDCPDCCIE